MNEKPKFGPFLKRAAVLFACLIMLSAGLLIVAQTATSATVDSFKNDVDGYNVTFNTPGVDATPVFSVENKVPIIDASMKISTVDRGDGEYPLYPKVDVGMDGDSEWSYGGRGYGEFGHQDKLLDNKTSATNTFGSSGGTKTTTNFLMPKDATVSSATMDVRGRFVPTSINKYSCYTPGMKNCQEAHSGNIDNANGPDFAMTSYDYSNGAVYWWKAPSNPTTGTWTKSTLGTMSYLYGCRIGNIQESIAGSTGGEDIVVTTYQYSSGAVYWYSNNNNDGTSFTRYTIATGLYYPTQVRIADMDNDGDNDVVIGCQGYYSYFSSSKPMIMWYENDGTPKSGSWTRHNVYYPTSYYYGYCYSLDVGNFNGDSYPDIAFGTMYYLRWAVNPTSGTGYWSNYAIYSSYHYYTYGITAADFNGDGYDDIATIQSYSYGGVKWYRNPHTTGTWTYYSIDSSAYYGQEIIACDLDGQNTYDLAVGTCYQYSSNGYDRIRTYRSKNTNPGGGSTHWTTYTISNNQFSSPMALTVNNFDGSNRDDVLCGSYRTGGVNWWKNNGAGTSYTEVQIQPGSIIDPYGIEIGDIDGDDDMDMVVAGYGSSDINWFENDGTPQTGTWQHHRIGGAGGAWNIKLVDMDDDDDLDVVAAAYGEGSVYWYRNNGAGASWTRYIIETGLTYVRALAVADMNDDGNLDVICASYYSFYGGLRWLKAPANPSANNWPAYTIDNSMNYICNIDVGDIDGDDDIDVAYITQTYSGGGVGWFECPANPQSASWQKYGLGSPQYGADVALGDVDWDGKLDIVYTQRNYDVFWLKNPANPKKEDGWPKYTIISYTTTYDYPYEMTLADIGQDGYLDVVFTTYYRNGVIWMECPDDPTNPWIEHKLDTALGYAQFCAVGDIDGDGVEDVAATGSTNEEVKWYKIQTSYCKNPKIDVGGDGSYEWQITGDCIGLYTFDFTNAMNDILTNAGPGDVDDYGNELVNNVVKMTVGAAQGKITVFDLDIEYEYTAEVKLNPHNDNLATEIQEYLDNTQSNKKNFDLRVGLGSASAGEVYLSDLYIEYNSHPKFKKDFNTLTIQEDSVNPDALDLSTFFEDDFDDPSTLTYDIKMSKEDQKYVRLTLVGNKISAETLVPNWNGDVSAQIIATDNGDGAGAESTSTVSNVFPIVVMAVNDEPTEGNEELPDVEVNEGCSVYSVDLDLGEYFEDIEDDKLYYKIEVDPDGLIDGEELKVSRDENNVLKIEALNDYSGMNIPVRVSADDDKIFDQEGETHPYKEFKVDVYNLPDDAPYFVPIPPVFIEEDAPITEIVDLKDYVNDPDSSVKELEFFLVGNVNSSWIHATVNSEGVISVAATQPDYDGSTKLTVKAWDSYNSGATEFWVYVIPANDNPKVKITSPANDEMVPKGSIITISGSAKDAEDLQFIEIAVVEKGGSPTYWELAQGGTTWQYIWDSQNFEVGTLLDVYARSYDGVSYSATDRITLRVSPALDDTSTDWDKDGVLNEVDAFPLNPFEQTDTDKDGYGDNEDVFPDNDKEWSDADLDGIGDNSDPTPYGDGPGAERDKVSEIKDEEGSLFSLWWVVIILAVVMVVMFVVLMVKKARSRKPVKRNKKVTVKKKAEAKVPEAPRKED